MYARTSTWTGTPEALERWAGHVAEDVAPMVEGLAGNAGAYFLLDRSSGRALTLTLWDSEDAAAASDRTAEQSRERTVTATGVALEQRGRYSVVTQVPGSGDEAQSVDANKQVSRRFTELFGTDDSALADAVFTPGVVFHGLAGGDLQGIEATKAFIAGYRAAFPDAFSTVEQQVAEDDVVVTRWRARGTHTRPLGELPPTGRAFDVGGITIERFADGRIAEVWVVRDELGLLRQLGAIPEHEAAATA